MRDTLFISHATPQDNDFAIWLASRLEMLGYKTWIDKNGLLGGEKFWQTTSVIWMMTITAYIHFGIGLRIISGKHWLFRAITNFIRMEM